ncbi:Acyl-CoA dehydrogenase [Allopseudospirillum japonicum]|uniref:3-methylmercaptopropionyl-CoA dehydrogenase n=1 Tax=Allopseudospirillum japonicum TaxID=64971 RepID=A0A1H6QPA3_9GAMM|nr:acyl-CoA dehydrogenase C-terminal domain-containing protein [Allopseudospirillum japonicum]SEI42057.1 Acyl-CoA dehydrogenase [Allopseudospirillum japonicum]
MPSYQAPLRDIRFVTQEVLGFTQHYQALPNAQEAHELQDAILQEGAKFAEQVLAPLNQVGDQQGCQRDAAGQVSTPAGFKAAYQAYVDGGWPSLAQDPEYGGQGLPPSLGMILNEMICSANLAWGMYPGLSHGAMDALRHHGNAEQKSTYLKPLIEGRWTGTMCLTEPHCGTDLGLIKTKAQPQADGSYHISGTKIFISAGDHDLAENIIHLVLAKLPDAPEGTRGISLFIVPKYVPDAQGQVGAANTVTCGALEHKMGIHGNSTCVMNFDAAQGWLVGEPHKGLKCMFTMMNAARIGVGIQGLGLTEVAYQNALAYARERLQMRALTGAKAPEQVADPIIVHPDVRRMLLTQKAFAEGGRALIYYTAQLVDTVEAQGEYAQEADKLLGLLTPIVKAFLTEVAFESTNEGLQVFGGHGFIQEWGMEQFVRDARITRLYEGTTGIQALDLLGRKVLLDQGQTLRSFTKQIHLFCQAQEDKPDMRIFIEPLSQLNKEWGELTMQIGMRALQDKEEVGAAAVDYLMYSGYVCLAYFWAQMAARALQALEAGTQEADFYQAKLHTATFYYQRLLPRTRTHAHILQQDAQSLMQMSAQDFDLGFAI